jgi:hypothetical protein
VRDDLLLDWLRPSALEGAWSIACAQGDGSVGTSATVSLLATTYSSGGFDFASAQQILREVSPYGLERAAFFRNVFWEAMQRARPAVLALAPRGRAAFVAGLPSDAAECLRRCEVLDAQPDPEALRWFDRLASLARGEVEQRRMDAAREAERRSFELESARLDSDRVGPRVVWVALDDNSLGYDIRSFERLGTETVPKLVEVKACATDSLEFYLTRNECLVARRDPRHYWLHLWNLSSSSLAEVPWLDIEPLVPVDTARGQWTEARIRWRQSVL